MRSTSPSETSDLLPVVGIGRRTGTGFATAALAAIAGSLIAAPTASAETYRGNPDWARAVKLVTNKQDRVRLMGFLEWEADCNDGSIRTKTFMVRPLDQVNRNSFLDRGSYRVRVRDTDIEIQFRVLGRGHRVSKTRWTGTFKAFAAVYDGGERVDRCRLPKSRWTVDQK